jgi:hypothetical protein
MVDSRVAERARSQRESHKPRSLSLSLSLLSAPRSFLPRLVRAGTDTNRPLALFPTGETARLQLLVAQTISLSRPPTQPVCSPMHATLGALDLGLSTYAMPQYRAIYEACTPGLAFVEACQTPNLYARR